MTETDPDRSRRARILERVQSHRALAPEPERVDVRRGLAWVNEGWRLFRQAPSIWIAICMLAVLACMVLAIVPVVGRFAAMLLSVLFAGSAMLGCRALDRGEDLTVGHLLAGKERHLGPLLALGALYLAGMFVIVLAMGLMTGGAVISLMRGGFAPGLAIASTLLLLLVSALILVPLGMAMWFAPALVTLHDVAPAQAMKLSFQGCLRNVLPFMVYGSITCALVLIASLPLMLGWLVLLPVLAGSVYAGYRDIFLRPRS